LDDDEKGTQNERTPGGDQPMSVISESGLYSLSERTVDEPQDAHEDAEDVQALTVSTFSTFGGF